MTQHLVITAVGTDRQVYVTKVVHLVTQSGATLLIAVSPIRRRIYAYHATVWKGKQ